MLWNRMCIHSNVQLYHINISIFLAEHEPQNNFRFQFWVSVFVFFRFWHRVINGFYLNSRSVSSPDIDFHLEYSRQRVLRYIDLNLSIMQSRLICDRKYKHTILIASKRIQKYILMKIKKDLFKKKKIQNSRLENYEYPK